MDAVSRRSLLKALGSTGIAPDAALAFQGQAVEQAAAPAREPEKPKHSIRFSVIGLDHIHVNFLTDAVRRGGGELVSVQSTNQPALAAYQRRYPGVRVASSEDEILNDSSIQLVCSAAIPDLRAPLGVRAMRHGKDYLSDKPAMVSLAQLAEVRRAIRETGRIFAILYSERFEVRAAVHASELVKAGAIGKVVQMVNLAPHQLNEPIRPEWFWDPARYGGILCDIGSHQVDEFLHYTGSRNAEVVASQVANVNHSHRPKFQDFGDMMLRGDGGFGYVRLDWFTPNGLGTWGDGRTFIVGTEGYMEVRKYADIAGRRGANHLFVVDRKQTRYIDCSIVELPFGPQFVGDIVNRTHVAQDQEMALLAAELAMKAQRDARVL
ncbi:MAG: Gfo/Idh/MocA family oxidoreductase [Acidobacteria bacterium]|nr:Gfo/Idh/MocA family oxidoreductase [Acidobacteriota bacterium]